MREDMEEEEDVSKEELEERVRQMEGEQEELAGSLQALTSHYARLQLRLNQVQSLYTCVKDPFLVFLWFNLEKDSRHNVLILKRCAKNRLTNSKLETMRTYLYY
jgi:hypothetical protein